MASMIPEGVAPQEWNDFILASAKQRNWLNDDQMQHCSIETISNVEHCGFKSQTEIRRADAFSYLAQTPDKQFEYIYIAPPQFKEMWVKALELVDHNIGWLTEDAWVVVQIAPSEYRRSTAPALKNLTEFEQRKYGTTLLVFYERKP